MLICSEMHVTKLAFAEEKELVNYAEITLASVKESGPSEWRRRVKLLPGKHQVLFCWAPNPNRTGLLMVC